MSKKLIFLDIDGTLTPPGMNVPPQSALDAIKKAQAAGNLVLLCTGRNYDMLSPLLQYGFDGVIGSSGGYVEVQGNVIYDHPMTEAEQARAMEVCEKYHIFRTVECKDGAFTDDGLKDFLRENVGQGGNSELLRWREQIESSLGIRSMAEYQGQPIYKVIMMATSEADLLNAKKELEPQFAVVVQEANGQSIFNGEMICPVYDKGQAVERVCEYLGEKIEDTIGFGDSLNDLEMIQTVGTSIVMENGSAGLKAEADDVCPAYDQDGLYKGFEKYHLF